MPVRVLFFDFGGTLVRGAPQAGLEPWMVWSSACRGLGFDASDRSVRHAVESTDRELGERIYEYLGRLPEFWLRYDARVMDRLEFRGPREQLVAVVEAAFREQSWGEVYPETVSTLETLTAQGVPLGVISNHTDQLREVLDHHGLTRFFRTVTYSQEAGAEKPDPRVFELALRRAGCRPSQAMHVGDSWEADYLGARRAGLHGVWLNRGGADPPEPAESVRDLAAVLPLLET